MCVCPVLPDFGKRNVSFEGSQALPLCLSGESDVLMTVSVEFLVLK